ncbi:hypothetical protein H7U37_08455 [Pseudoflavonifractor phocaeensis]|uniref:hypothetical protein n=1 Tax=Pseudoflavonifractor phocaeensis TaxID=1870988 RepID=UPI0019581DA9|nr:hypothetical protein [Pseudoflavonifractor phocaeensis]MBM6869874.1 hypothetical protein [Pseudoflavonifractor phocaeensis]MBM6938552.1 hypothetical protein [Pseudoflavonifractor phocaeensis]
MVTAITIAAGVVLLLAVLSLVLPLAALVCGVLPVVLTVAGVYFLIGALSRRSARLEDYLPAAAALGAAFLLHLMG